MVIITNEGQVVHFPSKEELRSNIEETRQDAIPQALHLMKMFLQRFLTASFREAFAQLLKYICRQYSKESVLSIGDIRHRIAESHAFLAFELFDVSLVGTEACVWNDLSNAVTIITAPFAAWKFNGAVLIDIIRSVVLLNAATLTGDMPGCRFS